ncbi:MAG TPA: proteasome accessory factor PafA2 family protein, partial [Gemmataceae bacterium]|nr:proteasome accessory factor PafA2 family protein [Gemmataceae bacterium]
REKVPVARAIIAEFGWFLASGGLVKLERNPFFAFVPTAGLVEGATPECRGPRQLLLYQRAQDALLSRATAASGQADGTAALMKNNRDGQGRCHGSHENYEATIASGPSLVLWRVLVALLPALVVPLLITIAAALALAFLVALPLVIVCVCCQRRGERLALWERALGWLLYLSMRPIFLPIEILMRLAAFRRARRGLLPFLVSRPIIAGAGTVGTDGRFGLSPRVGAIWSVVSSAAECSRPIFYFGHIWKGVLGLLMGDRWGYKRLFQQRQRLQLGVGDSNMAQQAEYLKIGTTLLVLDAIEAGALDDAPRLWWRPLHAMRSICADPELKVKVRLSGGRRWTALEIQRYYLDACRRYVEGARDPSPEAETLLRLWGETLDALEGDRRQLVGKIDWVTKQWLLETAGAGGSVAAHRKIDLRYHELSQEGYYVRLEAAGVAPTLVEPEEVMEAIGRPPEGTPASIRGDLIRQFAMNPEAVRASWCAVIVNATTKPRVVQLQQGTPRDT